MEEIKLRAFHDVDDDQYMLYDPYRILNLATDRVSNGGIPLDTDPEWKFMLWTGMNDSSGLEIYDGDYILSHEEIGLIRYNSEECEWVISFDNYEEKLGCCYPYELSVIGNKYENFGLIN